MNGVMTPAVSAGSNHVGASEMWTANVICPSGAAAAGPAPDDRHATASARAVAGTANGRHRRLTVSLLVPARGAGAVGRAVPKLVDQPVELPRVLARDLLDHVGRQVTELLGDVLRRLRPHAVGVGIVRRPHERLDAHL